MNFVSAWEFFYFFDIVSTCISFIFQINGENVVRASHDRVVHVIRHSGDTLAMKVVTVRPQENPVNWQHTDGTMTLPTRGTAGNKKQGIQSTQCHKQLLLLWQGGGCRIMVFNATFNNISVISWRSVLLVEETGIPGKKPLTCRKSLTNFIT